MKNITKKLLSALVCACLVLSFAACSDDKGKSETDKETKQETKQENKKTDNKKNEAEKPGKTNPDTDKPENKDEKEETKPDTALAKESFDAFADRLCAFDFRVAGDYTDSPEYFTNLNVLGEKSYIENCRLMYGFDGELSEELTQAVAKRCEGESCGISAEVVAAHRESDTHIRMETVITQPDVSSMADYTRKAQELILCDFVNMCTFMDEEKIKPEMSQQEVLDAVKSLVDEKAEELAIADIEKNEASEITVLFDVKYKDGKWIVSAENFKEILEVSGVELDEDYYEYVQDFMDGYEQRNKDLSEAEATVRNAFKAITELRLEDSKGYCKSNVKLFETMGVNSVDEAAELVATKVADIALEKIEEKGLSVSRSSIYDPVKSKVTEVIKSMLEKSKYDINSSKMLENGKAEFEATVTMPDFDKLTDYITSIDIEKLVSENIVTGSNVSGYLGTIIGAVGSGENPIDKVVKDVAEDLCDGIAKDVKNIENTKIDYTIQAEKVSGKWLICSVHTK